MSSDQQLSVGLSIRARAFSVSNLIGSPLHSSIEDFVEEAEEVAHHEQSIKSDPSIDSCKENVCRISKSLPSTQSVTAELLCGELWREFHALGTEMIITKAGRYLDNNTIIGMQLITFKIQIVEGECSRR